MNIHLLGSRFIATATLLLMTAPAFGAGFGVNERSAKATGRNNAVYAKLAEPGTLFYNPAGLSDVPDVQLSIGGQFIYGTNEYSDPNGERLIAESTLKKAIPNIAVSYQVIDDLTLGFGLMVPHGLAVEWPKGWAGAGIVEFVDLQAPHVTLGGAYRIADGLSVGIAGYFAFTHLKLERAVATNTVVIQSNELFKGSDGLGFAGSVGITYEPTDDVRLGVAYKTKLDLSYDEGDFLLLDADGNKQMDARTQTELSLPGQLDLAVGYSISKDIYIELDATYTQWSAVEKLDLQFSSKEESCGEGCTSDPIKTEEIEELKWKDVWFVRVGGDWQATDNIELSAGVGYDISPIPDETISPLLPGSDRVASTLGLSYQLDGIPMTFDASYMLVYFVPRTVNSPDGTDRASGNEDSPIRFRAKYKTIAHLFGLNIRYAFGS